MEKGILKMEKSKGCLQEGVEGGMKKALRKVEGNKEDTIRKWDNTFWIGTGGGEILSAEGISGFR